MRSADLGRPSDEDWDRHQRIIAGFESAWKRGERPKIGHYLPEDDPGRDALLVELVHADLEFRIKAGESARVEDYLRKYPALAKGRETVLGLIRAECSIRRRKEPGLRFDRYRSRFPQFGAELQSPAGDASTVASPPPVGRYPPGGRPAAELPLPRRFGKFELRQKLGAGSFGVVYRAWDTVLKREVAVKLPGNEVATVGPELAVFLRDARNSLQLRHPNIVEILDAGPIDGVDCMVRAYIEGKTLAERLREGPFTPEEAASIVGIVADAVDYAHGRRVIHRDLKPSNILLDLDGRPHVMDFGLARSEDGGSTLAPAGTPSVVIGTPAYMSPEQARGDNPGVDSRSDVYSLGVILYELLTGSVPFRGRGRMLQIQIQEGEPISPRELNDGVSAELAKICLKALVKDPDSRYQSAKELANDLRNYLEGRPVGTKDGAGGRSGSRPKWKSIGMLAAGSAMLLGLAATTMLWIRAEARGAREVKVIDRTFRTLLDLIGAGEPGTIGLRAQPAPRDWELAEVLLPMLEGDPALLDLVADARLSLAELASAEGSDRDARPRWECAVLACQESLVEPSDRPSRVQDLARACVRLAEIRGRAGDGKEARSLFDRSIRLLSGAVEVLQRRIEESPEDEEGRLALAECLLRLAEARKALGESSDIDKVESIASEVGRHSASGTPALDRRLGRLLIDVSRLQLAEGQPRLAEESARRAYRLFRDGSPEGDSVLGLARSCVALARASRDPGQVILAVEKIFEAVRLLEAIRQPVSSNPEVRRTMSEALFESARLLDRPARRPEAIRLYRKALRVDLDRDRDFPGAHATLADLARVRTGLARALGAEGHTLASIAELALATLDQARAVALARGEASYRSTLRDRAKELARTILAGFSNRAG